MFRLTEQEMKALAARIPTPFLVASLDQVEENYRFMRKHMPRAGIYYAMKANPTPVMPAGMVSLYHGYREADANSLLSWDHRDPYSGFPGYRCIRCRVEKEAAE